MRAELRRRVGGEGVVMRYEGDRIVVLFEDVGYRTLKLETVQARGLLQAV